MSLPARPAPPDPAEEELLALLREEIRSARRSSSQQRMVVQAEVTIRAGRIVGAHVQPPRKVVDLEAGQA